MPKKDLILKDKNCGACKALQNFLDEKGISINEIDVYTPKGEKIADKHDIMTTPSLITSKGEKITNIEDMIDYICKKSKKC